MSYRARVDEAYVMNLLGHLKLAHQRGLQAEGYEYFMAGQRLQADDAIRALALDLTMAFVSSRPRLPWPRRFTELRMQLDRQFAADPAQQAPPQVHLDPGQVLPLFYDPLLSRMTTGLGISADDLFHDRNLSMLAGRREWQRHGVRAEGVSRIEQARSIIRAAPKQIGSEDLLTWVVSTLVSSRVKQALREHCGRPPEELLREWILGEEDAETEQDEAEEAQFRTGAITPLLSYAAMDRRMARIQDQVVQMAANDLRVCDAVCPGLRSVLTLRLAVAIELEGRYRHAADLLLGTEPDEEVTETDLRERLRALLGQAGASAEESRSPRLADWQDDPEVRFAWEAGADRTGDVGGVAVTVVPAEEPERGGGLLGRLRRSEPRPRHLAVAVLPENEVVVRLYGLSPERETLLLDYLASSLGSEGDRPLRERILEAPLVEATSSDEDPVAEAMDTVPEPARPTGDRPAAPRLLFTRALEIIDPKPLSDPALDLTAAIDNAALQLAVGDRLFTCPPSVAALASTLDQ